MKAYRMFQHYWTAQASIMVQSWLVDHDWNDLKH